MIDILYSVSDMSAHRNCQSWLLNSPSEKPAWLGRTCDFIGKDGVEDFPLLNLLLTPHGEGW